MNKTVSIDVRDDIRNGREPFSKIMNAAAALQIDEQLLVIAPFEPVPLFRVLEKQGFRHTSQPVAAGDWEVRFTRQSNAATPGATAAAPSQVSCRDSALTPVEGGCNRRRYAVSECIRITFSAIRVSPPRWNRCQTKS